MKIFINSYYIKCFILFIAKKNGQRLQITLNFIIKNAINKTLSQAIQTDLKAIGAELILQGEEKQIYLDLQRSSGFDI